MLKALIIGFGVVAVRLLVSSESSVLAYGAFSKPGPLVSSYRNTTTGETTSAWDWKQKYWVIILLFFFHNYAVWHFRHVMLRCTVIVHIFIQHWESIKFALILSKCDYDAHCIFCIFLTQKWDCERFALPSINMFDA